MGNCISRQSSKSNTQSSKGLTTGNAKSPTREVRPIHQNVSRNSISFPITQEFKNGTRSSFSALAITEQIHQTISNPEYSSVPFKRPSATSLNSQCYQINDGNCMKRMTTDFLNGGYWPSWKHYEGLTPSSVPLDAITHVNYAFADIDGDGTVYLKDEYLHYEAEIDGANGAIRAWNKLKLKKPKLKVILAVGGGGGDVARRFAEVAGDKMKCFNFTQSIKKLIDLLELDGVDIDWEHPTGRTQTRDYLYLLRTLRMTIGWHRWITTALPAGEWVLKDIDLAQLSKTVDFINLMAYDFVGPTFANVEVTGHHAQLLCHGPNIRNNQSGAAAIRYMMNRGVPSRSIMLGIPTYGRVFKGADGPNQPFLGPGSGNEATYEVRDLPRPGMVEHFDRDAVAVTASGNGEFITYDNEESVERKAEFVKEKNLRGLFYWHLAGDRPGDESLVQTGHEVLNRGLSDSPSKLSGVVVSVSAVSA